MIEIKINAEIRNYSEKFFGLTLLQAILSALALGAAVAARFIAAPYLQGELLTWVSIVAAAPFALFAFFRFNGMSAEKFLLIWVRFLLQPKVLLYRPTNLLMEKHADEIEKRLKEKIPYYE